jgi:hypothetical protein
VAEDGELEGQLTGPISDHEPGDSGTFTFRSPFGEGPAAGAGNIRSRLSARSGPDSGSGDSGDSGSAADGPRKRARPKGSKSSRGKLSAGELSAARRKLGDTLSSITGFLISYYGTIRANKYKRISPLLAQRVYGCYQIPREAADSIGTPLADTFMLWFPDAVETTTKSIDPAVAIGRLVSVLQQTSNNERLVVEHWQSTRGAEGIPSNGRNSEPVPPSGQEGAFNEWMKNQAPNPAEIHPENLSD